MLRALLTAEENLCTDMIAETDDAKIMRKAHGSRFLTMNVKRSEKEAIPKTAAESAEKPPEQK